VVNAIKEIYAWMHTSDSRVETLEAQLQSMQAEIDAIQAKEVTPQRQFESVEQTHTTSNSNSSDDVTTTGATSTPDTVPTPIEPALDTAILEAEGSEPVVAPISTTATSS
jgi:hypothetical protein